MSIPLLTVEACDAFVRVQHAGQVDKAGRDYYNHHLVPIAAAVAHLGDHAIMAALLHDWIEDILDGDINEGVGRLRAIGCPEPVIAAVVSVTRITRADGTKEKYTDLIARSCDDPLGVYIKLADNGHNITSNPDLAVTDPKQAKSLLSNRYLPARDRLIAARSLHMLGMYSRENLATVLAA